ncbi:hypothetical protein VITFI_CDS3141 [Vitreoscilla filiformis]|uniref:HTH tetR-type domain-containing protein n=1 Tax=Vitreoscilla filiformis TaxID=63 RepID=A0A221KIP5_VITFI|nr:TetR/AcrR family transcriptional regulator [Vitreoscilla filiformis]ASM78918.1 hypothetical protein VITFI_CDS3141 [Vitreoscilla filiformis]
MAKPSSEPDRRIAKTKLALRDAMLALLPHTGWDGLSIQALCERANIGRSTFYLHYQGKDDLLSDSLAGQRAHLTDAQADKPAGLPMLRGLLAHMVEQSEVFRAVIGKRGSHAIAARFKNMVREVVEVEVELQRRAVPAEACPWLAS